MFFDFFFFFQAEDGIRDHCVTGVQTCALPILVMSLLLLYSMGASAAPATTRSAAPDPPVRVWFNSDGNYQYGDRAKVYAKAAEDGNLVVLREIGRAHV